MRKKLPRHLSYDYQLKLEEVPTKHADRMPLKVVMPGIILGFLMVVLGLFELMNGMYDPEGWNYALDADTREPLFSHTAVDGAFIVLGLGVIISSIVSHIRYKKIFLTEKPFRLICAASSAKTNCSANFCAITKACGCGWSFSVRHSQQKQVHYRARTPRSAKSIPLYISTDGTGIYQIWYYYAKRLNMPTLMDTDEGTVVKEVSELDKSLREYLFAKGMISIYDDMPNPPKNMACIRKPDRTVIKPRRVFWDVFNLLGAFWLTFYLLVLTAAAFNYARIERLVGSPYKTALIFGIAVVIAVLLLGMMFKKIKLSLKATN